MPPLAGIPLDSVFFHKLLDDMSAHSEMPSSNRTTTVGKSDGSHVMYMQNLRGLRLVEVAR